jgi:hypothetical protein
MLAQCLLAALALAFGAAMAFIIIGLVFAALAGVLTGPGIGVVVAAVIWPILIAAGILFAAGFIQGAINCIIAANQAPAAAPPGGAQQGLKEEDPDAPWLTCKRCLWWQKFITPGASAAAAAIYLLMFHKPGL